MGWGGQREKNWCQKYEEALTNTETNTESSDVIYKDMAVEKLEHQTAIQAKYILIAWHLHGALHCYCASLIAVYLNGGELSVLESCSLGD